MSLLFRKDWSEAKEAPGEGDAAAAYVFGENVARTKARSQIRCAKVETNRPTAAASDAVKSFCRLPVGHEAWYRHEVDPMQ